MKQPLIYFPPLKKLSPSEIIHPQFIQIYKPFPQNSESDYKFSASASG